MEENSIQQILCFFGFIFVLHRAFTLQNYPLLDIDPKPLGTHRWRLITASFYIPFVPGCSIFAPILFKAFVSLMVYLAIEEYMQIVFELRRRALLVEEMSKISKSTTGEGSKNSKSTTEEGSKISKSTTTPPARSAEFIVMTKHVQVAGVLVTLSAFPGDHRLFALVTYMCFIGIIVYFMYQYERLGFKDNFFDGLKTLCIFLLSLVWITWSLSHGILMLDLEHGGGYITILLCVSWIGDASAYYVGSRFGSHKVTLISPNKSWEGIIAEIFFALFLSSIFKWGQVSGIVPWMTLPPISYLHYLVIGLIIGILGVIGDIFESFVKRAGYAKDSGIFFPGHGGILDRFDSFLFVGPAIYYYVLFVVSTSVLDEISWNKYWG